MQRKENNKDLIYLLSKYLKKNLNTLEETWLVFKFSA